MCNKLISCLVLLAGTTIGVLAQLDPRIVGGQDADWNMVPWQASLRYIPIESSFGRGHYCGGVLIKYNTILTAAHCLFDENNRRLSASDILVVGGNLNVLWQNSTVYQGRALRTVPHSGYNADTFANDIGVIILRDNVPADHPLFRTIPLTTVTPATGTNCIISGWGTLRSGGNSPSQLQIAYLEITNRVTCAAQYTIFGGLPTNSICAGVAEGGIDSCQGDSGGPLVCNNALTGIVSFGYGCGSANFWGVYTEVSKYSQWIAENGSPLSRMNGFVLVLSTMAALLTAAAR